MKASILFLVACLPLVSMAQIAGKPGALIEAGASEIQRTSTGEWQYKLQKSAQPWPCEANAANDRCVEHVLTIANRSGETLECRLRVELKRGDGSSAGTHDGPALVLPRTSPDVYSTITDANTRAEIGAVDCKARTPYRRMGKGEGCNFSFMGKPFETYYPDGAKLRGLQGPVIVSFLLDRREGSARDVTVAESSLVPELDAAALRFIKDQLFTTNCPDQRYDLLMRFKLRDEALARTP